MLAARRSKAAQLQHSGESIRPACFVYNFHGFHIGLQLAKAPFCSDRLQISWCQHVFNVFLKVMHITPVSVGLCGYNYQAQAHAMSLQCTVFLGGKAAEAIHTRILTPPAHCRLLEKSKAGDKPFSQEHIELRSRLCSKLGWSHWQRYENSRIKDLFPADYPLF